MHSPQPLPTSARRHIPSKLHDITKATQITFLWVRVNGNEIGLKNGLLLENNFYFFMYKG